MLHGDNKDAEGFGSLETLCQPDSQHCTHDARFGDALACSSAIQLEMPHRLPPLAATLQCRKTFNVGSFVTL